MRGFSVTYERFMPHDEHEDICDADERGYVVENVSLRDALRDGLEYRDASCAGHCEPDCSTAAAVSSLRFDYWNECTRENIKEGISESRTLHIPNLVTDASRRRICRLFKVRGA